MNTQYIFFSHSQEDITKARRVRDYLESNSFEPILFNLKCLKDSDELTDLARREIETRKWFLYLDSRAARSSARVKAEAAYAGQMQKKIYKVNLESGWLLQKIALDKLIREARGQDK